MMTSEENAGRCPHHWSGLRCDRPVGHEGDHANGPGPESGHYRIAWCDGGAPEHQVLVPFTVWRAWQSGWVERGHDGDCRCWACKR